MAPADQLNIRFGGDEPLTFGSHGGSCYRRDSAPQIRAGLSSPGLGEKVLECRCMSAANGPQRGRTRTLSRSKKLARRSLVTVQSSGSTLISLVPSPEGRCVGAGAVIVAVAAADS